MSFVVPANAAIHIPDGRIPAFAGITNSELYLSAVARNRALHHALE